MCILRRKALEVSEESVNFVSANIMLNKNPHDE